MYFQHWLLGLNSYEGTTNSFTVENLKSKPKLHPKLSRSVTFQRNDKTDTRVQETSTLTKTKSSSHQAISGASSLKPFHIYSSMFKLFGLL